MSLPAPLAPTPLRSLLAPAVATLVALAVLVSLGVWQLQRKSWKEGLLAQIEARAFSPPGDVVAEATWPAWAAADDEFRRVRLDGTFMPADIVPIQGLAELKPRQATLGFYLFEPLRRDDGTIVVVNRGFVPADAKDATLARLRADEGRASLVGLVRAPETRGLFVPENDPIRDTWFVRNLGDIVATKRLARVAPFYVDADSTPNPGGWPKGGQTQLTLRNDHLSYALTWFGLALTLIGVFTAFVIARLKPPAQDETSNDGLAAN